MPPTLTLPTSPAMAQSRFGLCSNTTLFRSPFTGQTQTQERAGARWQASYTLPPMKREAAAVWQSFLLQLRGGAGRFYGYDPDAATPRGSALMESLTRTNMLRNSTLQGAALGPIGGTGSAPSFWSFGPSNGLTREIISLGVENGLSTLEVRFYGTPTAAYTALAFESATMVDAALGQTWTNSFYYRLSGGSMSNIANIQTRFDQSDGNGTPCLSSYYNVGTVDSTWRRATLTRTLVGTTPATSKIRSFLFIPLTVGAAIDITLKIAQPQLELGSTASAPLPTLGTAARTRGNGSAGGACVYGGGQSGTNLNTWNWQPNSVGMLKMGDYIAYDTALGRSLHVITADVQSDAYGRAMLTLEPPIRTTPADNAPLMVQKASCCMALVEDSVQWEANAQGVVRLSFTAEERF